LLIGKQAVRPALDVSGFEKRMMIDDRHNCLTFCYVSFVFTTMPFREIGFTGSILLSKIAKTQKLSGSSQELHNFF
jgi:hypothetical protein